jgi:NADH dehydrogenase
VKNVVVLGSGFAGLWAAVAAARRLDELRIPARDVGVTVISSQPFHDIRVRNYESDLTACRIPLSAVLDPVGVAYIAADVMAIDTAARSITFSGPDGFGSQDYDRLVFALGSSVARPDIPGLREFGFDVDTYDQAMRLSRHLG